MNIFTLNNQKHTISFLFVFFEITKNDISNRKILTAM
jgi:hypothetical protein